MTTAVIGLGSVLLGDDGFGPTVVEHLRAGWDFPEDIELVDGGTPGLGLAGYLHGREQVILIDAVAATGTPGELRWYEGAELRALPMKPRVNPHDPAIQEALWITELSGQGPRETSLLGVIPARLETGTGLSPSLRALVVEAARRIVVRLESRGTRIRRRGRPHASLAWWAEGVG